MSRALPPCEVVKNAFDIICKMANLLCALELIENLKLAHVLFRLCTASPSVAPGACAPPESPLAGSAGVLFINLGYQWKRLL